MKKTTFFIIITFTLLTLIGCDKKTNYDIVTTMFPSYDIASNIVGDKMSVSLLTKPGVEVHDFSPSSLQMTTIKNSHLFIYTSLEMDQWLNNLDTKLIGKDTISINLSKSFDQSLLMEPFDDHAHFWTDPLIFISLIDTISKEIINKDPINKDYYQTNTSNYKNQILAIHKKMDKLLKDKDFSLYFAGHNALKPFSDRYNFTIIALNETNKPDADNSLKQIVDLLEEIKETNTNYLFVEELMEPKIAITIQKELKRLNHDLEILELHGYHNITKEDFQKKVTYLDLFTNNYNNIKKVIGI